MVTATMTKRDVSGRSLEPGEYMLTQPGTKPVKATVFEDAYCDLYIRSLPKGSTEEVIQRVDELAIDVEFHRVGGAGGEVDLDNSSVGGLLEDANRCRKKLLEIERSICGMLDCEHGDGSITSDAVQAAVRDGLGSEIELLDLAGKLRR